MLRDYSQNSVSIRAKELTLPATDCVGIEDDDPLDTASPNSTCLAYTSRACKVERETFLGSVHVVKLSDTPPGTPVFYEPHGTEY